MHLKALDNYFSEGANLGGNLHVIKILDATERLKFTIASYNAGEGRIARAQADAVVKNLDPKKCTLFQHLIGKENYITNL